MTENLHSIGARPVQTPVSGIESAGKGQFNMRGLGDYGAKGKAKSSQEDSGDSINLSPEAQAQLRKLKQRDAEVRAHEQAHLAAAGQYAAGAPSYEYQKGPDGRQYAIGGHVDIDVSSVEGDPKASKQKAQQVRRAALAPGEPSGKDRAVAAKAASMEAQARIDEREEKEDEKADDARVQQKNEDARVQQKSSEEGQSVFSRVKNSIMAKASQTYAEMSQLGVMTQAPAYAGGISMHI